MVKNYTNFLQFVLFFVFLSVLPSKIHAQCAGDDAQKIICDIENPSYQNLQLFALLGGTPTPGGTWSDDNNLRGLDVNTGELNAQIIENGGVYHYTYTVPGVSGCTDNSAVVTLTIGSYAGIATHATVCSDEGSFNLFTAFNSSVMGPHSNGRWTDMAGRPVLSTIQIRGVKGTFQYIYTLPAISPCSVVEPSTTVTVTIVRAPETGTPKNLELCGTTDLAGYTNFNLHDLLKDEDSGGRWDGPGLSSPTDYDVNLQALFDAYGESDFFYTYSVLALPNNKICPNKTVSVVISLEKRLDFTGSKVEVSKNICESEIATATYSAKITQGPDPIPNGEYSVTFDIAGPTGGTETIKAYFSNGELSFPISSGYFRQVGTYNISITKIVATAGRHSCTSIFSPFSDDLTISPLPRLNNAILTANPICQNDIATVEISNATQLTDGDYRISYFINGANVVGTQITNIRVAGGKATFQIPANLNANSGVSTVTITNITNITNPSPQCSNTANVSGNFTINPLPVVTNVKIVVNDSCLNDIFTASVSGLGSLTKAKLSYLLSDGNISTLQIVDLTVSGGNASFVIPAALLLNSGSTIISATYLTNDVTGCGTTLSNVLDSFSVNAIPVAPIAENQSFCKVEKATIANLLPRGTQYKWYNSATSVTPLADTYLLKSEDYYVREFSVANCKSPETKITVQVNDSPAPVLNSDGQDFCGLKNPTISDLSKVTNLPSNVVWYDAPNNGNLLTSTTLLTDKKAYYGFDFVTQTGCISDSYLEVTVSLSDCDPVEYKFFIPDGFSPNGDNVNDTFKIPNIEFLYPDYTLEIFNRYGNVMFKGNKNKPDWDGKNSESAGFGDGIAPNGVYFYIINFNKDNKRPEQGRLYLNR
jgi:gliding motility-associated-like protein